LQVRNDDQSRFGESSGNFLNDKHPHSNNPDKILKIEDRHHLGIFQQEIPRSGVGYLSHQDDFATHGQLSPQHFGTAPTTFAIAADAPDLPVALTAPSRSS
jgi:hypothetical protein